MMGIQTISSHMSGLQPHLQMTPKQNSWFTLPLEEIEKRMGDLGKPLGSMDLDELLKNVWIAEANQSSGAEVDTTSSASSLQRQASLTLARAFSGKTVHEVWRNIQQGQRLKNVEDMKGLEREPTLGETTLEDLLVNAGLFADVSSGPIKGVENSVSVHNLQSQMSLSPSPSIDSQSDTPSRSRKRGSGEVMERTIERRLRRKIKNRESAARSRARKQAYHNELVGKVSLLEEENLKLKKEKLKKICARGRKNSNSLRPEDLEEILPWELSPDPRYQLRRTNSF